MNVENEAEILHTQEDTQSGLSRRSFLKTATFAGATTLAALGGLSTAASAAQLQEDTESMKYEHDHLKKSDADILIAAQIAEALAVTTYSNIINTAPFFKTIPDDDQGYLIGARRRRCPTIFSSSQSQTNPLPSPSSSIPQKCSPMLRPPSTFWSLWRTHSSRPIW